MTKRLPTSLPRAFLAFLTNTKLRSLLGSILSEYYSSTRDVISNLAVKRTVMEAIPLSKFVELLIPDVEKLPFRG